MSLPFTGEMMECVVCGAKEKSNPERSSDWRMVDVGGERFYVCPKELPPDGSSAKKFEKAYHDLLTVILQKKAAR